MSGIDEDELSRALHARLDAISVPLRGLEDIRHRAGVRRRRRTALSSVAAAVVLVGVGATGVRLFGVQNTPQDPATTVAPTTAASSRSAASPLPGEPDCVNGVKLHSYQELQADGMHRAAFQVQPCGQDVRPVPLETYSTLVLRTSAGDVVTVPVTRKDATTTPEQLTTTAPVCMILSWPDTRVGAVLNVATVTVTATAQHPAYTLNVPMTLGSTSGLDQSHWVADSGACLGSN